MFLRGVEWAEKPAGGWKVCPTRVRALQTANAHGGDIVYGCALVDSWSKTMVVDLQSLLETLKAHEAELRQLGVRHAAMFGFKLSLETQISRSLRTTARPSMR